MTTVSPDALFLRALAEHLLEKSDAYKETAEQLHDLADRLADQNEPILYSFPKREVP
jgi:hypothetical protein